MILEPLGAGAPERLGVELVARLGRGVSYDRLAEQLVGDADDRGLPHAVQGVKYLLDLARVDLLATALDQVVGAPDPVQVARPRRGGTDRRSRALAPTASGPGAAAWRVRAGSSQ